MLGIFGAATGNLKLIATAAAVAVAAAAIGLLVWRNDRLRTDLDLATAENGALRVTVETQRINIEQAVANAGAWQDTLAKFSARLDQLQGVQENANAQVTRINDIFARHDLDALLQARPGLIEARINRGSSDMLRMLECASDPGRCDAAGPAGAAPEPGPTEPGADQP